MFLRLRYSLSTSLTIISFPVSFMSLIPLSPSSLPVNRWSFEVFVESLYSPSETLSHAHTP